MGLGMSLVIAATVPEPEPEIDHRRESGVVARLQDVPDIGHFCPDVRTSTEIAYALVWPFPVYVVAGECDRAAFEMLCRKLDVRDLRASAEAGTDLSERVAFVAGEQEAATFPCSFPPGHMHGTGSVTKARFELWYSPEERTFLIEVRL